ncbi:SPOC-like, C-terminal domain,Spen paralogue/orthologue C-terminal, metazoa,Spen paralogue [Cinara cedri]|uniref:SPOC-like, C-terminal domain,Spen paralogue/orthologue C-terminal, metazoa,Spen paralogue n=1 Tax=Cinara cedri TaxID=506608 RepID=A0A5E4NBP1_9HEMI|nr:SPOC-like, C-terminal domain,Spen paralogue/orthologue C-terminal, metazoa,Spen paralogue [Cinara cedri]
MIGLPKHFKSKQITVKIDNMKRRSYGDSPPLMRKKRHSSINRYDGSSDERQSPERMRRRARSPPSPRSSRYSERDEFGRSRDLDRSSHPTYKVLCVSALHPKASDEQVKEALYREYRKFGEFSVKISHELEERMAYVCFRSSEDARDAKHSKPRISLFDKIALVAPVYESRSTREHYESRARHSRSRSISPDYERYYHRSPIPSELHRPHPAERFYERLPYGALPHMLPPRDFREIGLPPLHPHELMIPRGPLLHHVAPIHPHLGPIHPLYGPPRHFIPPFRPHPHPHLIHDKKDRFPNYLQHIPPEDDPLATRTLFAGNLEISISDEELRRIFGRYGVVEDIDVKRPLPGTGNAYAFVRYQNLDMAHRAKVELSGQYLGKFQCKIGYGKSTPTQRIWVGGLGPWTSLAQLEREFDRFGVIKKIEYVKGDTCAYIQFESIDAATAAVKEMRGVALGGQEHKLRTDFADGGVCGSPSLTYSSKSKSSHNDAASTAGDFRELTRRNDYPYSWPNGEYSYNSKSHRKGRSEFGEESREFSNCDNDRSFKHHSVSDIGSPRSPERSPLHQSINSDVESEDGAIQSARPMDSVRTLSDLALKCTDVWQGSLVLKSSQFPTKCYLTSGDPNVIESMMKDEDGKSTLRITQRLRLDEPKLEDVSKRIKTADMHAIFLALPCPTSSVGNDDPLVLIRTLRNLVSYLKQKEAAGVISLVGKEPEPTGVLYAFPPCEYSANLLKKNAKNLSHESLKDDHLVVVVVSGGVS